MDFVLMASTANLNSGVTAVLGWIPKTMVFFTSEPAVYFVGVALIGAVAGVTRKFVPMRKR